MVVPFTQDKLVVFLALLGEVMFVQVCTALRATRASCKS